MAGVFLETGPSYSSRAPGFNPGFFSGIRVAHLFSFLCCVGVFSFYCFVFVLCLMSYVPSVDSVS